MSVIVIKPDEIGDFVMAIGAIRLLAEHYGEQDTTLVVKSEVAPLAQREFSKAGVIPVANSSKRKEGNAFAGFVRFVPSLRRLRQLHYEAAVCLRPRRNSMQTLLFTAARAGRHIAAENVFVREGGLRRKVIENLLCAAIGPELVPYPSERKGLSLELEAHRSVVSRALGREVGAEEILPRIESARWVGSQGWLVCPFSSRTMKDYSAELWLESFLSVSDVLPSRIGLAGGPDQIERLRSFASVLGTAIPKCAVEVLPCKPLNHFPDLVAEADLVLTVDTAAAHFACAIDVPAVIVDSGNNPGVYGPYGRPERQVWLTGDRKKFGRLRWRETVPPSLVAAAIRRALAA